MDNWKLFELDEPEDIEICRHLMQKILTKETKLVKMNLDLNNKNVVVIGGTRGIGLAIANGFANNKSNVIVVSRKLKNFKIIP